MNADNIMPFIIALVVIVVIVTVVVLDNKKKSSIENMTFGYINDSLSNTNEVSYDGRELVKAQYFTRTPDSNEFAKKQRDVYQGIQSLNNNNISNGKLDFDGRECKPSCCGGNYPSTQSCTHGCVCYVE